MDEKKTASLQPHWVDRLYMMQHLILGRICNTIIYLLDIQVTNTEQLCLYVTNKSAGKIQFTQVNLRVSANCAADYSANQTLGLIGCCINVVQVKITLQIKLFQLLLPSFLGLQSNKVAVREWEIICHAEHNSLLVQSKI